MRGWSESLKRNMSKGRRVSIPHPTRLRCHQPCQHVLHERDIDNAYLPTPYHRPLMLLTLTRSSLYPARLLVQMMSPRPLVDHPHPPPLVSSTSPHTVHPA